jgi:lipoate-protein ligase A
MYYIENICTDPRYNLALEEYVYSLLSTYKEKFMLLWRNSPSIIVGRFQNTAAEVNEPFVRENNLHVIRRITGGGAVYHDLGNLNYTFAVPNDSDNPFYFQKHSQPIVDVLQSLGVYAEFNSRNDLAINGLKFSGNAQHMDKKRLLHHGTLLFNSDLEKLSLALKVSEDKFQSKAAKSVKSRVTNILQWLPRPMSIEAFKDAILRQMDKKEGFKPYFLSQDDRKNIERLIEEKYSTWSWNWGRSPEFTEKKSRRFNAGKVEACFNIKDGVITGCRFFGDFFGDENLNIFEGHLLHCLYEEKALRKRLASIDTEKYFASIPKEELVSFICG